MLAFIDAEREAYGVEPICSLLPIAPVDVLLAPGPAAASRPALGRGRSGTALRDAIQRIWDDNYQRARYGWQTRGSKLQYRANAAKVGCHRGRSPSPGRHTVRVRS